MDEKTALKRFTKTYRRVVYSWLIYAAMILLFFYVSNLITNDESIINEEYHKYFHIYKWYILFYGGVFNFLAIIVLNFGEQNRFIFFNIVSCLSLINKQIIKKPFYITWSYFNYIAIKKEDIDYKEINYDNLKISGINYFGKKVEIVDKEIISSQKAKDKFNLEALILKINFIKFMLLKEIHIQNNNPSANIVSITIFR